MIININYAFSIQSSNGKSTSTLISYAKDYQFVNGEQDSIYGEIITSIGDYNHDGYQDFLVGGRIYNGWQGKAWIYFGGPDGIDNTTSAFTILGEQIN